MGRLEKQEPGEVYELPHLLISLVYVPSLFSQCLPGSPVARSSTPNNRCKRAWRAGNAHYVSLLISLLSTHRVSVIPGS